MKADINISEEYSPKKKKTNMLAPCSVINPATNSDSNLYNPELKIYNKKIIITQY